MNILVAGSTGNTGSRLVRQLVEAGHTPIALHRASSDTSTLPEGVEKREADLTKLGDDVCAGADVVVFAAGSGGDTGEEMTDKVDRDGARRLIDIAAREGVERFVMLSSVGASDPDPSGKLAHYLKAKHDADEHLKSSGLAYTIVRPVALTDDDGNRNVRLGDEVDPAGKAARGDVAAVLARAATDSALEGKVFLMESMG
ncbi:SDR family oxidoreductase [Erythrobacter sp. HL-111]|uniref:SDR family oxidoreductase n=1 Tax=Erythrobacter sp. HL-111 TaxID=1798193 RepID=UPI0006DBA35F|nr:SDR family oxidoreductase [Erythrobacter sp. HL-111]KPP87585.1 MAG: NADH(P)-binding [Erythrobacteraceae bacterium HL-111]SDR80429.1 NAD(P)H-binding [Erythrobacter sp. HL-111]